MLEHPGTEGSGSPEGTSLEDVSGAGEEQPTGSDGPTHVGGVHGGARRPRPKGSSVQPGGGAEPGESVSPQRKGSAAPRRKVATDYRRDYQLTEADYLGEGNAREKAQANIAAIRILKECEAENRPA
jgi:hypothetical protein